MSQQQDHPEDAKYEILGKYTEGKHDWEHLDYAKHRQERDHLLGKYRLAFGPGWIFKTKLIRRRKAHAI